MTGDINITMMTLDLYKKTDTRMIGGMISYYTAPKFSLFFLMKALQLFELNVNNIRLHLYTKE